MLLHRLNSTFIPNLFAKRTVTSAEPPMLLGTELIEPNRTFSTDDFLSSEMRSSFTANTYDAQPAVFLWDTW